MKTIQEDAAHYVVSVVVGVVGERGCYEHSRVSLHVGHLTGEDAFHCFIVAILYIIYVDILTQGREDTVNCFIDVVFTTH